MNPLVWFDEPFSLRFVQTLLHFVWQGALIAAIAFALEQCLRRGTAHTKYLVNVLAMLAILLRSIVERATAQEYHVLFGGIDSTNAASIALHDRFGFARVAGLCEVHRPTALSSAICFWQQKPTAATGTPQYYLPDISVLPQTFPGARFLVFALNHP